MKTCKRFFQRENRRESGQAMVEFALVLPILLLLLCGIIDFGWMFFNQLTLNNWCREGARYTAVNVVSSNPAETPGERDARLKEGIIGLAPDIFAGDAGTFEELVDELEDNITIYFTNNIPTKGDAVVTITADMTILTPVLSTISGGKTTRTLSATVTMKAES